MRLFSRQAVRVLGSLLLAGPLLGCDLLGNAEGLGNTLLDPDAALLDAPGRKLASGTYSSLVLDGSLDKGGYVLAKRTDVDPQSLAIISFVGDGTCEIAPLAEFQRVSSRVDVALPGLVAYQRKRDDRGIGDVEFTGFDCKARLKTVPAASLPDVPFPRSAPTGLLTLGTDGTLTFVDAVNGKAVDAVDGVSSGRAEGDYLWTLESGVLVAYDKDFKPLASFGDNIRELLVLGGTRDPSAAIVDDAGLSFVSLETGEITPVTADACSPVSLGSNVIGYFSPCSSRTLKLSIPGLLVVGSEEDRVTVKIATNVIHPENVLATWKGTGLATVLYLTSDDAASATGALHVADVSGADGVVDDRVLAEEGAALVGPNIYVDWEGSRGRLVTPRYEDRDGVSLLTGLTEVARDVGQIPDGLFMSPRGVLANFDGSVGDLCVMKKVDDAYECRKLASGVPVQGQTVEAETGAFAFVGDFDGTVGTPYLVIDGKAREIGKRAFPGTLRFLEQPRAVAYLADNGVPGTATLRTWLIDAELDFQVAGSVTEYRELPWPSPGLLYAVPKGDDAGIWFAKAR